MKTHLYLGALLFLCPLSNAQDHPHPRQHGVHPPHHENGERQRGPRMHRGGPRPGDLGANPAEIGAEGIVWYPILADGIREAQRSNRPIFFMAAASQCNGVPGVF